MIRHASQSWDHFEQFRYKISSNWTRGLKIYHKLFFLGASNSFMLILWLLAILEPQKIGSDRESLKNHQNYHHKKWLINLVNVLRYFHCINGYLIGNGGTWEPLVKFEYFEKSKKIKCAHTQATLFRIIV